MTRLEASDIARASGLENPRIIPHKGKDGQVAWHLYHGPDWDTGGKRPAIVLPVNVDKKRLEKAIEQANGQT